MRRSISLSGVICAFNEAERIGRVLRAASGHPLLDEIIVVDDGSADDTALEASRFADVRVIRLPANLGKTQALARGVAAARSDHVMLLDADLVGLTARYITELAAPVLRGEAESSISLRGDCLTLYRALGIDFVSGERVLPRALFGDPLTSMADLPRWGCEVFINERIIEEGLRVAVVDWPGVTHTRKRLKVGAWEGAREEMRMMRDALRVLSPAGVVRQHVKLMRLSR